MRLGAIGARSRDYQVAPEARPHRSQPRTASDVLPETVPAAQGEADAVPGCKGCHRGRGLRRATRVRVGQRIAGGAWRGHLAALFVSCVRGHIAGYEQYRLAHSILQSPSLGPFSAAGATKRPSHRAKGGQQPCAALRAGKRARGGLRSGRSAQPRERRAQRLTRRLKLAAQTSVRAGQAELRQLTWASGPIPRCRVSRRRRSPFGASPRRPSGSCRSGAGP